MKIIKFRIRNYKSIEDSGNCYLSPKFTILAGKNESGKTTVLAALADFDASRLISKEARTIGAEELEPDIAITFELADSERRAIVGALPIKLSSIPKNITLHKKIAGDALDSYYLDQESAILEPQYQWEKLQKQLEEHLDEYPEAARPTVFNNDEAAHLAMLVSCRNKMTPKITAGISKQVSVLNEQQKEELDKIITTLNYSLDPQRIEHDFVSYFIDKYLPTIILHTSEDIFPDSVSLEQLDSEPYMSDLEKISDFKKDLFTSGAPQRIVNNQNKVNVDFDDKINKYWTQDSTKLEIQKDGDHLFFWIREDNTLYAPSQRSQGKKWFLSFFVRICARLSDERANLILIDEPGLYLHAKAQKNLLEVLRTHTSTFPVVFTTHSPYLITEENLENVRLVEKEDRKTRIIGKIHDPSLSDKETLTPVLTAIGLSINDSIADLGKKDNTVVEGPEDVFYLNAFKLLLPDNERPCCNFISGGGAGNMPYVGAILEGWGCNVKYLLDNDRGGKNGATNLAKLSSWAVASEKIKAVSPVAGNAITDLFSKEDFVKYVLEGEPDDYECSNSQFVKNKGFDKVLIARKFYQKAQKEPDSVKLSKSTIENIKKLFVELSKDE